ncbi:MAG: DUF3791 domain-containing protein [Clostridia bacterium]|nr:DUF3791 domain-containing protein [Clostridia bacterium]
MSEAMRKQVNYTVACIHEFARKKRMSQQDAFIYLDRYQGLSFLSDCYEIEHTLSMDDAMDDLELICRRNGGALT